MTDANAFEAFVRRHQDLVFGLAVRLLGDSSEAEDVSQAVFLKAYERFDALVANPAAKAWLRTVTTNQCLSHLTRLRARWRLFSERRGDRGDREPPYAERLVSPASQAADLERAEEHARLERGLRRLPDHQRVPLVLFHFERRSYRDIAALLGVSVAKVKTDLHRGRKALRLLLGANDAPR